MKLGLFTKLNIINKQTDASEGIGGNFLIKRGKNKLTAIFNYKDNKIIIPFYHEGLWIDLGTENEYQKLIDNIDELKESYPEIPIKI